LATGCRYGELCALKVRDFAHNKISIHRSKSGKARDIVLSGEGVALFEQLTAGRAGNEILLRNFNRADLTWRKDHQIIPMQRACVAANIKPVNFHALRHTWASLAVMGKSDSEGKQLPGMPLQLVALNLGHRDTTMVEKFYGHLAPSYIDAEIRRTAPEFGMVEPNTVTPLNNRKRA
jgi:integrase